MVKLLPEALRGWASAVTAASESVFASGSQRRPHKHKDAVRLKTASLILADIVDDEGWLINRQAEWARRWRDAPGRRVLFFAPKDYSGSFFKWAEALNRHTDFAARLVVLSPHEYRYPLDLVPHAVINDDWRSVRTLIEEADVLHLKDEKGFFNRSTPAPPDLLASRRPGTPLVFTAFGGYFRRRWADKAFRRYVAHFDARVAITPDLIYPDFDAEFIPHAIDTDRFPYSWEDGSVVSHSPSTAARKGTNQFFKALNRLRTEGLDLDVDVITGVSHDECLRRKQRSTLFFDQAGREIKHRLGSDTIIGWYGNSAIEAAVFGIPTIAHLSREAFDGARRAGRDIEDACAIINTPYGADGIRGTIQRFFASSPAERFEYSNRTRRWIEDFHSYPACATALAALYQRYIAMPRKVCDQRAEEK
jgi:hypothetical protein